MNPTEPSLVDGSALQALRLQHGLQPSHVARLTGLRLRQVQALEAQKLDSFRNRDHMVQCALLVATRLSGEQHNGLPKANVFRVSKSRRAMGERPRMPPPKLASFQDRKFTETPEFFKMLGVLALTFFLIFAVAMPVLFTSDPPPTRVERVR